MNPENSINNSAVPLPDLPAPAKAKTKTFALVCAIFASMTWVLIGYDNGVMSGAAIYIQKDLKISDTQVDIMVVILNLYCVLGSPAAGKTSDLIGRRYTIVLVAAFFFVGEVLTGTAVSYTLLMIGRFVAGIGVGCAFLIAPVYIAEVSPASSRGFLTSFPQVFIEFGILLGYASNWCFSKLSLKLGWRLMLGIGAVPSIFVGLGVLAMPESPRWLVLQGRLGDAKRVLVKISDSEEEAQERLVAIQEAAGIPLDCTDEVVKVPKEKGYEVLKELLIHPTPPVRRVLIAAIGIHCFQGMNAVFLYRPRMFQKAGIVSQKALLGVTVAVGITKSITILVAAFFLDKVGRRPLLLSSVAGMILALILLATGLTVIDQNRDEKLMWAIALCMAAFLFYVVFYSVGLGPIAWVYSSEIFPIKLRAQGISIGIAVNRVVSVTTSMTFLFMTHAITIGGAFFFFAGITTMALVFFYKCLPETRGRNLEDMDALFGVSRNKIRQDNNNIEKGQVQLGTTPATRV